MHDPLHNSTPVLVRSLTTVLAVALLVVVEPASAALSPPAASDAPGIDQHILDLVASTATKGYAHPETAAVRHIRKSNAINGTGYCGDVTIEGSEETTMFHVVLKTSRGPSVLRLSDYPAPERDPLDDTVRVLMQHFGCMGADGISRSP